MHGLNEQKILNTKELRNNFWDGVGVGSSAAMRLTSWAKNKYIMPERLDCLIKKMKDGKNLPLEQKPVVLDARRPDEWRHSHIWSARNIHAWHPKMSVLEGVPKEQMIVTYCAVGLRSGNDFSRVFFSALTHYLLSH